MTSTTRTAPVAGPAAAPARPALGRRAALCTTAFLAGALPVVWGIASLAQLATGTEADHRFHQVTGQGLLMCALWLWPVLALGRDGLRGRRPSTATALLHVSVVAGAVVAGVLAPDGGGLFVAGWSAVTGGLLWSALPIRPLLALGELDVVLAPFAMLTAALSAPFVVGEIGLQNAMGDEHAEMAHYFDMAWLMLTLVGLAGASALAAPARRLAVVAGAGVAVVGASRWLFTGEVTWSAAAVLLGLVGTVAGYRRTPV